MILGDLLIAPRAQIDLVQVRPFGTMLRPAITANLSNRTRMNREFARVGTLNRCNQLSTRLQVFRELDMKFFGNGGNRAEVSTVMFSVFRFTIPDTHPGSISDTPLNTTNRGPVILNVNWDMVFSFCWFIWFQMRRLCAR